MTLEYNANTRVKNITAVLDEYSGWFMQVLRFLSYPDDMPSGFSASEPRSYNKWTEDALEAGVSAVAIKKLNALHADLNAEAQALIRNADKKKERPDYKSYDKLLMLFEEFSHHIRRLEIDMFLEDSGVDPATGLRSAAVFRDDIKREMDRLARQGKQFSLALVRIDGLEDMKKHNDEEVVRDHLKTVAGMIRRSVRSFDDAYLLENDEFLLALKQSDMSGGIRAMERLKKELQEKDVVYSLGDKQVYLTLSSCIAEPMPEDNVDDLLDNLQNDLDSVSKDDGAILEYFEMSPLQRYAKQIQD